jgi:RNA 3'-phosphate cyclase
MIDIDGSQGEGGGQILRTSVAMSALRGEPVRITNIRSGRDNPGLRPQHLKAVEAVGLLCDADVQGLAVGSREVVFKPGKVRGGELAVDVGTAGSATLVLQALLPVALCAPEGAVLDVTGGTDVSHSPTADYFQHVFCHFLGLMGAEVSVKVLRRGFYPRGGGRMMVEVKPWSRRVRLDFSETGRLERVDAFSVGTEHLRGRQVAERQVKGFLRVMSPSHRVGTIGRAYALSDSVGSSFTAYADLGNARVGVCVLGERDMKAEDVGARAAEGLLAEVGAGAPLDEHMADQIIPYLAIAGGRARVSRITGHAWTNMDVVNRFGYHVAAEDSMIRGS